jgi:hypothetical protein
MNCSNRRRHDEEPMGELAMRIVSSLLLLLLVSTGAYAQTPQVDRIDVLEYGIYTLNTETTLSAPNTASGIRGTANNILHTQTTQTIPAQLGVRFGFLYKVVGVPTGMVVPLHLVTIFPFPGLLNQATQHYKSQEEFDENKAIGVNSFRGYGFDNNWEAVPGVWTFQIWYRGRMLAEQKFTIVKQ